MLSDVKSELHAISKLLAARPGIPELEEKLCTSLKSKLQKMGSMGSQDLVQCYEALGQVELPPGMIKEVTETLDSLALEAVGSQQVGKLTSHGQECNSFHLYLSSQDMAALETCSMWEGCLVLSKRLKRMGVKGMKESLKKHATAVLVYFEMKRTKKIPCEHLIYSLSQHLLQSLKGCTEPTPHEALSLASYPASPDELDPKHFSATYDKDDLPLKKDLPELSTIMMKHVKVRSSGLGNKKASWFVLYSYFVFEVNLFVFCVVAFLEEKPCVCVATLKDMDAKQQPVTNAQPSGTTHQLSVTDLFELLGRFNQVSANILGNGANLTYLRSGGTKALENAKDNTKALEDDRKNNSQASPGTLPVHNAAPLAALEDQTSTNENDTKQGDNESIDPKGGTSKRTLEDFEQANLDLIKAREAKKTKVKGENNGTNLQKPKGKAKPMKRPSCKPSTTPSSGSAMKKGCLRCRGSRNGCDLCLDKSFKGLRLNREEWKDYAKLHGLKGA